MRIIDRLRHQALIKNIPAGGTPAPKENPLLKKQLEQTQKDLNLILNKWKFGDAPLKSASEFLNNFEPWINKQLDQQKELKEFLAKNGLKNLGEIKNVNSGEESEQLKFYKENIKTKEGIINELQSNLSDLQGKCDDYKEQEEVWKNTEADYLKKIKELGEWSQGQHNRILELEKNQGTLSETDKEKLAEYEDLITERDELARDKKTLEQQNLALNNQLKNKQQEVTNKDKALDQLKKAKDQAEVNHQKKLKEKNGLITTLNQEIKQYKEKCKELDKQNAKLVEELLKLDPGNVNM